MKPRVGMKVFHRRYRLVRRIVEVDVYRDIPGSVRIDKPILGFSMWNIADFRSVKK